METVIRVVMSNFTLTFLVLGFIATGVALLRASSPLTRAVVVEALMRPFLLFSIGLSFLYNFVMHTFFGAMSARFIGWADSPFQTEVGFASFGFAAVGLLAVRGGFELRLGAILGPSLFLLGAAAGHAYQMAVAGNFAPGNAGAIFYTDILVPVFGLTLLWLQRAPATDRGEPVDPATTGRVAR